MPGIRAAIVTGPGLEHRVVANALTHALGDSLATVVVETLPADRWRQLTRYRPLVTAERLATKAYRRLSGLDAHRGKTLAAAFGSVAPAWPRDIEYETPSANTLPTRAWLNTCRVSHLFVYGTGILRVDTLGDTIALNLHTGYSPDYRGADTNFWPLYDGRPEAVGVTVHACTAALDGGAIYARATVPAGAFDDPEIVFVRQVQAGAELYADVARQLLCGATLTPVPQDLSTGRCYRFVDRTWWHDARYAWQRRRAR
jgi:hypothetical protein